MKGIKDQTQQPRGLDNAGWLSQLLWLWVGELVDVANRKPLREDHLGSLPATSKVDALLARFDVEWERQKRLPKPSLIWALMRTFKLVVYRTGVVELCIKVSQLVVPVIVRALLQWYSSGDGSTSTGVSYALVLFLTAIFFQGIVQAHNFMLLYKTGMDLRSILCARVYEKALTVSSTDRAALTTGEVVNLMSADAEKVGASSLLLSLPFSLGSMPASQVNLGYCRPPF